jgi:uncharacterized protein (TIRG00374 family)
MTCQTQQEQQTLTTHIKPQRRWLKLGLRIAVSLLIFVVLLRSISWATLLETLLHAQHTVLLMGLTIGVLCNIFSAYTWHSLLRAEHIKMDLARCINLYLVGLAFSHLLPSSMGGDVAKAYYSGRESGNVAGATSAVLLSRIVGFLGMLLMLLPSLWIWHRAFTPGIIISCLGSSLLLLTLIGSMLAFSLLLPRLSQRFQSHKWMQHHWVKTALEIGQALSKSAQQPGTMLGACGFTLLFWLASFLNYYAYASAIGIHIPLYAYIVAIPFTSMVALLPFSINGFGLKEGALVFVLATMHVPGEKALLLALLMDVQILFLGLIGAGIYLSGSTGTQLATSVERLRHEEQAEAY